MCWCKIGIVFPLKKCLMNIQVLENYIFYGLCKSDNFSVGINSHTNYMVLTGDCDYESAFWVFGSQPTQLLILPFGPVCNWVPCKQYHSHYNLRKVNWQSRYCTGPFLGEWRLHSHRKHQKSMGHRQVPSPCAVILHAPNNKLKLFYFHNQLYF